MVAAYLFIIDTLLLNICSIVHYDNTRMILHESNRVADASWWQLPNLFRKQSVSPWFTALTWSMATMQANCNARNTKLLIIIYKIKLFCCFKDCNLNLNLLNLLKVFRFKNKLIFFTQACLFCLYKIQAKLWICYVCTGMNVLYQLFNLLM